MTRESKLINQVSHAPTFAERRNAFRKLVDHAAERTVELHIKKKLIQRHALQFVWHCSMKEKAGLGHHRQLAQRS